MPLDLILYLACGTLVVPFVIVLLLSAYEDITNGK